MFRVYGCEHCRRGYYHFCPNKETLEFHRSGDLAETVAVPEALLCVPPENVSDADLTTGDVVAVVGAV